MPAFLLSCFFVVFLQSCQSVSFRQHKDLSLKISISSEKLSVSAYVFIKENNVRIDILKPFSGVFSYLYLKGEEAVFLIPSIKKYYKGDFKNRNFLPWSINISAQELVSVLKGEHLENGVCMIQRRGFSCKKEGIEILLKKQGFRKTTVVLKTKNQQEIKIKIRYLSHRGLKKEVFSYNLKDYYRLEKWDELEF